jgi:DNA-binding CsgD family transcriptional regulator
VTPGFSGWAEGWLNSHEKAALVVSPELQVRWCSEPARRILDGRGPLVLRGEQVAGASRVAHEQLIRCVSRADPVEASLAMVDGEAPQTPLLLKARRLEGGADEIALSVGEFRAVIDLPNVRALFSVTPAEGDVVRLLAGGLSAVEIADQLDIAVLTVRTHIKRAYSKLGVHSKEQLFAKLSVLTSV